MRESHRVSQPPVACCQRAKRRSRLRVVALPFQRVASSPFRRYPPGQPDSKPRDIAKMTIDPVKLDKLAQVAIKVGLQLAEGQDLVMTAPMTAAPLVRRITEHAYKAGAGVVTTIYSDEEATLARYKYANDQSFDKAAGWLYSGMAEAFKGNAARLAIAGDNPMMLSGQDPDKVSRAQRANSAAYKPALQLITGFDINWNIVSYPKIGRASCRERVEISVVA